MALTKYNAKRNFQESPEPTGGNANVKQLRFVIQKHHATNLHYDFRLEMEGVLKSWAVPKGPSTDPDIKRLAIMVEDHPYDYRNFEGVIPSGYGAGTVIVWDEGVYAPAKASTTNKKTIEKELIASLAKGKLHIVLQGEKLKGEYALVKTHGKIENAWLLFKVNDKYISKIDITQKDKSVISKKTLSQIAAGLSQSKKEILEKSLPKNKKAASTKSTKTLTNAPAVKKRQDSKTDVLHKKIPTTMKPMLATAVEKPFNDQGWQFEIKWDGYRVIAFCNKNKVELKSRNNNSFSKNFLPVKTELTNWGIQAILDGEVVVLNEDGVSNFSALQNWRSEADGELIYYVFDILWLNGKDLTQLPLSQRRIILNEHIHESKVIRFSENFDANGIAFFETAKNMGLEGIMAKKTDSVYSAGNRTKDWVKIKANKRQEMIISGYTLNSGSSKSFSALLLGVYEKGELIYTGKVGTGFSDKEQIAMLKIFKPLIRKTSPFSGLPNVKKTLGKFHKPQDVKVVWVNPKLICEVTYTEITTEGIMRHPSFVAMRIDKSAKDVTKEKTFLTKEIKSLTKTKTQPISQAKKKTNQKLLLVPLDEMQIHEVNGHEMQFNNLNKVYWPKEKITKRDLLNYYHQVAPYILPYLKSRPQSMNRHPNGIDGKSFYFKDVTGTAPNWVETFEYTSESDNRLRKYLVAKDEASLLYMATLGCIEMNPWHSKVETEDYPDWCIIDLDPAENSFQQVIDAAKVTNEILLSLGVTSYPKTSGSTGIHIYIPLAAKYNYDQSKEFARIIATLIQREIPKFTSIERMIKSRKGKMYIDFLQNRPQATVAAPYSVRPKPGATVSMPLQWDEVKKGLKMNNFNIHNAMERIKSTGDIFKPVLGKGINLESVIKIYNKNNP